MFTDLPSLLNFYKLHYLDTTPLIRPAPKRVEKVMGKYDFDGSDPDDLPFKKGELLTVVSKDEEQWWTARNSLGQTGSIPVPYVAKVEEMGGQIQQNGGLGGNHHQGQDTKPRQVTSVQVRRGLWSGICTEKVNLRRWKMFNCFQRSLPAYARVKQSRVPNAYDKTALRLEVGDIVKVTKMSINGQWEGELNGKVGHFPFTHVEFIDSSESGIDEGSS